MTTTRPPMPDGITPDTWDCFIESLIEFINPGFNPIDAVIHYAGDLCDDDEELETLSKEYIAALIETLWANRLNEQTQWSGRSDSSLLDESFAQLEAEGIVARMNFTCCQTCGSEEIYDEIDDSRQWNGFVYFHEQDTERLAEDAPSTLFLSYGAFCKTTRFPKILRKATKQAHIERSVRIGHRIVAVLTAAGLTATWNGDFSARIQVAIESWQRPLPAG